MTEIDGYEVLGLGIYFEDLPVGRKFRTIGRTLTETDLVNFISVTGLTEVLFSNIEFLKHESDIKQRVVPGAMVYSFAEGLLTHATMQHTGFAFLNMELNVHAPTLRQRHDPCRMRGRRKPPQQQPPQPGPRAHHESRGQTGRHLGADLQSVTHGEGPDRGLAVPPRQLPKISCRRA